jgi:hypothetical protein
MENPMTRTTSMWHQVVTHTASAALLAIVGAGFADDGLAASDSVPRGFSPVPFHALCYRASAFAPRTRYIDEPFTEVDIVDRFGASVAELRNAEHLCTPANKNGEDPDLPFTSTHLANYKIRSEEPEPTATDTYVDQFGELELTIRDRASVMVIAGKAVGGGFPAFPPSSIDNFQCYDVRESTETRERFRNGPMVTIEDQFGTIEAQIRRPRRVCAPADVENDIGQIPNSEYHLVCYDLRVVTRPQFELRDAVHITHQFGGDILRLRKPTFLCVPALRAM